MKFTKMQGIGNDYIYLDCVRGKTPDNPYALSRKISDRHFGAGSDGLVLICRGDHADFRMRMYNADGSESEMCGNATRCIGKYVFERGLTSKKEITLETGAGIRKILLNTENGNVVSVQVDMGEPMLRADQIPVDLRLAASLCGGSGTHGGQNQYDGIILGKPLEISERVFSITCVSMGNPHCIVFVDDVEKLAVGEWGPRFENHPLFPERTNTEFAKVLNRNTIRMRVWERGSGETMACGTGACATLAAAALNGLTDRRAVLLLNGGTLDIFWDEKTNHIMMTGPAEFVFDGEWPD